MAETPTVVANPSLPYAWPDLFEEPVGKFVPLSNEDKIIFDDLMNNLRRIGAKPNGFWMILNALIATSGEEATLNLHAFLVAVRERDPRDLNALCAGMEQRIIVVPQPRLIMPED